MSVGLCATVKVIAFDGGFGRFLALMAVLTVGTESLRDSSLACGHFLFGDGGLATSTSQYKASSALSASTSIKSLGFFMHSSLGHQNVSSARRRASGLNHFLMLRLWGQVCFGHVAKGDTEAWQQSLHGRAIQPISTL